MLESFLVYGNTGIVALVLSILVSFCLVFSREK